MNLLLYALLPLLTIVLVLVLVRGTGRRKAGEIASSKKAALDLRDGSWLLLSERIFDRGDYVWIRDELGFPGIARDLARSRRSLAIQWLRGLKASFAEMVRTPDPALPEVPASATPDSWRLLWLTLRIHFLLNYALFVVRVFGPYHRLIPLNWGSMVARFQTRPTRLHTAPTPPAR